MIAKILLTTSLLISSTLLAKTITFQKQNITIETEREQNKLTKEELEFPLEITGYDTKRTYLIENSSDMKKALEDAFIKDFAEININCIFRRECKIEKDIDFAIKYINENKIRPHNIININIANEKQIKTTVKALLSNPENYMKDLKKEDLELIKTNYKFLNDVQLFNKDFIQLENDENLNPITNMFIKKFNIFDIKDYKRIVSYDNIPKYMSSLIGSKYCNTELFVDKVIMDKKCQIPLYNYKTENLNTLFVNTYYVGVIYEEKIIGNKVSYKLKEQNRIKNKFKNINESFSQLNLPYYSDYLEIDFSMKNLSKKKFIFNEIENLEFKEKREKEFKEFILVNKPTDMNDLITKMNEKSDKN